MTIVKVKLINGPLSLELFLNKIGMENVIQVLHGQSIHDGPIYTVIYKA